MYDHIEKIDKDVKEIYLITNNPLKYKATSPTFGVKGLSPKFIYSLIDMSFHNHKEVSQTRLNSLLIEEDISIKAAKALFTALEDILSSKQNYEFSLQDEI